MSAHENPVDPGRIRVDIISETPGRFEGQGVHTAFLQTQVALKAAGLDVRVNDWHPSDIVHIQTMGLPSFAVLLAHPNNSVVTAHVVADSFLGSFILARLWRPIGNAYMRLFYGLASQVVAVSPEVAEQLADWRLRSPARLVPNAIDTARFATGPAERAAMRQRLGIAEDAFVVLCTGQVQPRKGVDDFVAAARALPDVTFVWVGGQPFKRLTADYDRMRRLMAEAPDNCIFAGEAGYDDMPGWYAGADMLLFPSRQETFGLTIIEAAAAGLPLVLNDLDAYVPLFGDAYIPADPGSFISHVEHLRDDAALRAEYAARARRMAARYDTLQLGQRLLDVYSEVLMRRRAPRRLRSAAFARSSHRR